MRRYVSVRRDPQITQITENERLTRLNHEVISTIRMSGWDKDSCSP
jgi:hypothetical protein